MMRRVLLAIARADGPMEFADLMSVRPRDSLVAELGRLRGEGLIGSTLEFDGGGACLGGTVGGLTDEGEAFVRDIESDDVWAIIIRTLDAANVDLSYPLLKEVCEEIVRRYVTSLIPEIGR